MKFVLPPATNWYSAHILDVCDNGFVAYGSKSNLVLVEIPQITGKYIPT